MCDYVVVRSPRCCRVRRGEVTLVPPVAAETIRDRRSGHGHREQGCPPVRELLLARQGLPELPTRGTDQHAAYGKRHHRARRPPFGEGFAGRPMQVKDDFIEILRKMMKLVNKPTPALLDWHVTRWAEDPWSSGVLVHARRFRRGDGALGEPNTRRVYSRARRAAGGGAVCPRRYAHRSTRGGERR